MATVKLKVARIGNSRGVRLPAASLRRYRIGETVVMEERSDGILLRPAGPAGSEALWEDTAREMAASSEDWTAWDTAAADGLDDLPWRGDRKGRVAEPPISLPGQTGPAQAAMKRYEIRWTALDPTQGAEMAKTRPAVIVSLDALNRRLQTVTVCPLTSQLHPTWRSRLQVRCGGRPAEVAVDQIRTVSKVRLGDRIGSLSKGEAAALRRVITEMYGE